MRVGQKGSYRKLGLRPKLTSDNFPFDTYSANIEYNG